MLKGAVTFCQSLGIPLTSIFSPRSRRSNVHWRASGRVERSCRVSAKWQEELPVVSNPVCYDGRGKETQVRSPRSLYHMVFGVSLLSTLGMSFPFRALAAVLEAQMSSSSICDFLKVPAG